MDIFEYNEGIQRTARTILYPYTKTPSDLLLNLFHFAVRWPTRALQQEEEEDAVAGADQSLSPPEIKVCSTLLR